MAVEDDDVARPRSRDDSHLVEACIRSEQVFAGALLDVRRDRVRLPDGNEATREYVVHPGAVLIVPQLDDGRFVVERQFRYANAAVFIEFPAGKLDAGEAPLQCAKRELREEAGYMARTWTRLGRIHSIVSYSTEAIELYLASGLEHVGAALDAGEFLDIEAMRYEDIVAAVDRGEITDGKTIAALYHLERRRSASVCARRIVVSGRVQGVGYRQALMHVASSADISGWVRNRSDATVEALLQGPTDTIDRVIAWARGGPPAARVTSVQVTQQPVDTTLYGFNVLPTR